MFIQVCLFLLLLIKCYGYQSAWNSDHNDHRIPQDVMVDVVNNLALKLLLIHNEGNDNNIAISPYGALSVLVALEEGLQGNAANEIQRAAHIPSDISVVRIGLRDIHRHLKSYFIPEEGFLSGLTLSHDNVTLHREYEDILRFYGFDIDSFNSALYAGLFTTEQFTSTTEIPTTSTEIITSTTEVPVSTTEINSSTIETASGATETSTVAITSTENISEKEGNDEMTTESTNATPTERVTRPETSTAAVETTTSTTNEETTSYTTEQKTTEILTTSTSTENSATTLMALLIDSSTLNIIASTEMTQATGVTFAELPSTTPTITPNTETTSSELSSTTHELIQTTEPTSSELTISTKEATLTTELSTVEMTSTTEVTSTTFETTMVSSIPTTATAEVNVSTENEMNIENFSDEKMDKQNDVDIIEDSDATTDDLVEIIDQLTESVEKMNEREETTQIIEKSDRNSESHNSAISIEGIIDLKQNNNYDEISKYSNNSSSNDTLRRNTRSLVDYIMARYYDDHFITQRPPPYNSESDLFFLINGKYREYGINYMTYDTVLPFYYISHLNTLALRFPLDSSKYYLLLLLPESSQNINKLICDMRLNTSLKHIIDNLRYTHVKAIIPSFMLKGYVILTSSFQRMGIGQVFEPRQADFSPMTGDKGIYVTNIEQAITVNIRNYVDPVTMNNNKYLHRTNPVLFKADHPFLYFVIDSEIDVTLMAGKIVNPLNSRIR